MSDFEITRTSTEPRVDTRWRASQHGQFTAQPGTLDLTKFVEGTHYNIGTRTDNVIPSGVFVQYNAGTKLYEPWIPAPSEEWAVTTAYAVGARVRLASGAVLEATTAGTSDAGPPVAPAIGSTVTDGTVVWTRQADQARIDGVINDNQGIDVFRRDGSKASKSTFARLLHGFLEARFLPIAAQAAAAPSAEQTTQITYI